MSSAKMPAEKAPQPLKIVESDAPASQPARIVFGIQGGRGSFNEEAVTHYIKENGIEHYEIKYLYTSENVMAALSRGEIDLGQCAIYNSAGGFVEETVLALEKASVKEETRFSIQIAHAMMIRPDQDFAQIDTIMCHPQVLAQCKNTLAQKYPHFAQTSGEGDLVDNAKTAEALALKHLPNNIAVMGSRVLAQIYGLQIVDDNLQDLNENFTEFILASRA
ncbi:MAG TPA: prephenate dehydratase domain-containing protein [Coleofasciculaceae cyanobacterium]|jgi:prephenate dehydratase